MFDIAGFNEEQVVIGTINDITSTNSPVPGLTQDDSDVRYCNENNLPENCNGSAICHCPHLVELELCEVYEFFLRDDRGKVLPKTFTDTELLALSPF